MNFLTLLMDFSLKSSDNVINSLNILWQGMLAIFIAIGIIFIFIYILSFFTNKKRKN